MLAGHTIQAPGGISTQLTERRELFLVGGKVRVWWDSLWICMDSMGFFRMGTQGRLVLSTILATL